MIDSIQVRYWKAWAKEMNVDFMNYFECFREYSSLQENFISGDIHWNEQGHQLIADEFLAWYRQTSGRCLESYPRGLMAD
ncbi:MAG: SGNH/GDSL hydrolase family protein [Candidatus Electrothrix sp. AR3]|nr:SGNH/GDSL hydrolase family protein [Candidatus Electrothrix sp. AR3]